MTKLELTAVRTLPDEYVIDGTSLRTVGVHVVAVHPTLLPIIWTTDRPWCPLTCPPTGTDVPITVGQRLIIQEP